MELAVIGSETLLFAISIVFSIIAGMVAFMPPAEYMKLRLAGKIALVMFLIPSVWILIRWWWRIIHYLALHY